MTTVEEMGKLLSYGAEDIFIPGHMVPVFNLGSFSNWRWDYVRPMCRLLIEREV